MENQIGIINVGILKEYKMLNVFVQDEKNLIEIKKHTKYFSFEDILDALNYIDNLCSNGHKNPDSAKSFAVKMTQHQ